MTAEEQIVQLREELAQVRADLELCMAGLAALAQQQHNCPCSIVIG